MKSLASSSVPMSKKSLEEELTRLIDTKSAPKDVYHNHSFCQPLFIAETLEQHDQFQIIVDKYLNESKGKAKKLDQYRQHVESIKSGQIIICSLRLPSPYRLADEFFDY